MNINHTKRITAVAALTALLAAGVTACSDSAPEPVTTPVATPTVTASPSVTPEPSPEPSVAPEDVPSDPDSRFESSGIEQVAEVFGEDLAARLVESGWEVGRLSWLGGSIRDLHKPHSREQVVEGAEWFKDLMTAQAYDRLVSYVNSDDPATYSKALALIPTVEPDDGLITELDGVEYYVDATRTATMRFTPSEDVRLGVSDETGLATYQQDVIVTAYVQDNKVVSIPLTLHLSFAPGADDSTPWLLEHWWLASNGSATVQDAS